MIFDRMFYKNDIFEAAMQASILKNDVIQNNIANADVPNFKKKTVVFDKALSDAIDASKGSGRLDLTNVRPKVIEVNSNHKTRIDGNGVDVETEMVDLYTNSVRFDVMQASVARFSNSLSLVTTTR